MYLENDISTIECPKCNKNNDNLEMLRLHVFTQSSSGKNPYYDIKCYNCDKVFTKQVFIPIKDL